MKILFIHLTDLHIGDESDFTDNMTNRLVDSLKSIETFDTCNILFTGDIAHSCQSIEYENAKKILADISKGIKEKFPPIINIGIFVVPGNHDIDFEKSIISRTDITDRLKDNETDEVSQQFISKMSNYFEFSKGYNCFQRDNFLEYKTLKYGETSIGLVLVNSALFSLFKDKSKDNDKGLHYLPKDVIQKLQKYKKATLNIMLIHHEPKFFTDEIEGILRSFAEKNMDFVLFGHEHFNQSKEIYTGELGVNRYRCGGPLKDNDSSIFNAILYDTVSNKHIPYKFEWDKKRMFYISSSEKVLNGKIDSQERKLDKFFAEGIAACDKLIPNATLNDLYVFPDLIDINNELEPSSKIMSLEAFMKKMQQIDVCIIEGGNSSGKTALCRKLFIEFAKDAYPLLLVADDFTDKVQKRMIENAFKTQYSTTIHFNQFEQLPNIQKVLIIDDAFRIERTYLEKFIEEMRKHFGLIIITTSNSIKFDLLSVAKNVMFSDERTARLKISDIYYDKRKQLINKLIRFKQPEISEHQLDKKTKSINDVIKNQLNILNLNPEFITLFTNMYISSGYQPGGTNIFNAVFYANIVNTLKSIEADVNKTLLLLQKFAYHIHVKAEYPMRASSYNKIIDEYNESAKKGRKPINTVEFINLLIRSRIIRFSDETNGIEFSSNSYLSYFVAKEMLRIMIDSADMQEIEKSMKNVCFGLNADIILFLCYLVDNKNILKLIIQKSQDFYNEQIELSFDPENVQFIVENAKPIDYKTPEEKDKSEAIDIIEMEEHRIVENGRNIVKNVYDYDESTINDEFNKIVRGLKYLEIIAKILPDFIHLMDDEEIFQCSEAIYTYPNKLLYTVLKPLDSLIGISEEQLKEILSTSDVPAEYVNKDLFLNKIHHLSEALILNIYDLATKLSIREETVTALENFPYQKSTTHSLINALLYENLGDTENMGKRLEKIASNKTKDLYQNMIKKVIHKHLLFNQIKYVGYNQHLIDKFLGKAKPRMIDIRKGNKK